MIYLIAKKDFTLAPKANAMGTVWRIGQQTRTPHPAPFPPDLVRNCLAAIEEGPILDPFIGSGTTGLVADERGLDWIGIDISHDYLDTANRGGTAGDVKKPRQTGRRGRDVQL